MSREDHLQRRTVLKGIGIGALASVSGVGAASSAAEDTHLDISGGTAPSISTGTYEQITKLAASDGDDGDMFGTSVAVGADTIVVGADRDEDPNAPFGGAAYAFRRVDGSWGDETKIVPPEADSEDSVGQDVAVSGNTVLIGASGDDEASGFEGGAAYVYEYTAGSWEKQAQLAVDNDDIGGSFGTSVALEGDTAVLGAPFEDDPNGDTSGAAYIFQRSGGAWSQQAKLVAEDGDSGDTFGQAVDIAGDTVLVGARNDEDPNGGGETFNAGSAYVFTESGGTWSQQSKLAADDGEGDDLFGLAVALSDDTAFVGSYDDAPGGEQRGAVYVFERSGDTWTQTQKLVPDDGAPDDLFGGSIDAGGDQVVIGAVGTGSPSVGAAYIFEKRDGSWQEADQLVGDDAGSGDGVGSSVAISGETVVAGASGAGPGGAAYVFGSESAPGEIASRSLSNTSVAAGGALTVTLSASFSSSQDSVSILDEFSGPLSGGSITSIAVDGSEIADESITFSDADAEGVTVAVEDVPAGTLEVTYSVSVSSDATTGTTIEFTGNTDNPDVSAGDTTAEFGTDTATVTENAVDVADTDGDGDIDDGELRSAIVDWSSGRFNDSQLRDIIVEWSS